MATMKFEDHFSQRADTYASYRPHYPAELFAYLAGQAPSHQLAWDCATGNGQAAIDLAGHFAQVVATDASAEQIEKAELHPRVAYCVEPAEKTSLAPHSLDLVTVAVAVHWFDLERFYQEVKRVLKEDGVIAVWTYHRPVINPKMDKLIAYLDDDVLGSYWPERIHYLKAHYKTLPFPFDEIQAPAFTMQAEWVLDQMVGFMNSWSAVRRHEESCGFHPLKPVWDDFLAAWGDKKQPKVIHWPLYMRVGRNSKKTRKG